MFSLIGFFAGMCAPVLGVGMTVEGVGGLCGAPLPQAMQGGEHG